MTDRAVLDFSSCPILQDRFGGVWVCLKRIENEERARPSKHIPSSSYLESGTTIPIASACRLARWVVKRTYSGRCLRTGCCLSENCEAIFGAMIN